MVSQDIAQAAAKYISPININGLHGRVLKMPPRYKTHSREILFVYGHHAMIERSWGLVQNFNDYGSVTLVDLPGFGGMDSFAKIGLKPTLDNFADYLATFVKMRYNHRRFVIVGVSFGFVVATRMLQKYPELAKKVDLVISEVGFMHGDDFRYSKTRRQFYSKLTRLFATPPAAFFFRTFLFNRYAIEHVYKNLPNAKLRFSGVDPNIFQDLLQFEVKLWKINDVRTHWMTTSEFLMLDNCQSQVDVPVWHVSSAGDQFFDNATVEQHMRIVYKSYEQSLVKLHAHTPHILASKKEMSVLLPAKLKKELRRK